MHRLAALFAFVVAAAIDGAGAPWAATPAVTAENAARTPAASLVTSSCQQQTGAWLHLPAGVSLAIAAWLTWLAWSEARRLKRASSAAPSVDVDRHGPWKLFLAHVATGVGLLSTLTRLAMRISHWGLTPCMH